MDFNSIPSLEHEINRLEKLLERPNYQFPHTTKIRINGYKRRIWNLKHPIITKIRQKIANMLEYLLNRVQP